MMSKSRGKTRLPKGMTMRQLQELRRAFSEQRRATRLKARTVCTACGTEPPCRHSIYYDGRPVDIEREEEEVLL